MFYQYPLFSLHFTYPNCCNSLIGVILTIVYDLLYWTLSLDFNLEKALPLQKIKI